MPTPSSTQSICALCRDWLPIPGQDSIGLCPHLSYPNNRTFEHDCCLLKKQAPAASTIPGDEK